MTAAALASALTEALTPLAMSVASAVALRAGTLARLAARRERWESAVQGLDGVVAVVVRGLEGAHVQPIRRASRAGKIAPATKALLRAAALASVKRQLGARGLATLSAALGFNEQVLDDLALERFITGRIEAHVHVLRSRQRSVRRGVERQIAGTRRRS
ncbi:MAG: hypothetical protein SFX73_08415 [Kofleriaceae bacterium]|nr:hypothetical protein [Kofleriaceae bacterium]